MSTVRIADGTRRAVLAVMAGLVSLTALAAGSPAQASVAGATHAAAAAHAAASGGTWGKAEEVPGITALAADGSSYPAAVSCGAPGNCSAGGYYTTFVNVPGPIGAFVVSEQGGTWGTAEEVPGTAALNQGGNAALTSLSCASAGNCGGGGDYTDGAGHTQAFVVNETNGTWGTAEEVPGTAALGGGQLTSVSCASAGNCSAVGNYPGGGFVVSETNGTWGTAEEVPGTAALGGGPLTSVSCASAGNCSAGGYYYDGSGNRQVFVVSERNGTWGTAKEVPGIAALNQGGTANLASVSCGYPGNCSAGGYYTDRSGHTQAFIASEKGGTWGRAKEVPGTAVPKQGLDAALTSVSCASAGNCSAGGYGRYGVFVVSEKGGIWGTAKQVPGLAALGGGAVGLASVSCASAGNCSAGGDYRDRSGHNQVFVVSENGGIWGTAEEVPGTAALNQGGSAQFASVSCASAGHCSAVGYYTNHLRNGFFNEGFVVNES